MASQWQILPVFLPHQCPPFWILNCALKRIMGIFTAECRWMPVGLVQRTSRTTSNVKTSPEWLMAKLLQITGICWIIDNLTIHTVEVVLSVSYRIKFCHTFTEMNLSLYRTGGTWRSKIFDCQLSENYQSSFASWTWLSWRQRNVQFARLLFNWHLIRWLYKEARTQSKLLTPFYNGFVS